MKIIDTLKRWVGLGPKPAEPEPAPEAPQVRETTLPNGRVVITDERGNFVRFKTDQER